MIYLSLSSQCIERNWIRMGLFWGLILLFSSLLKNIPLLNTGTKNSGMKNVSWKLISFSTFVRVITYASLGRFAKKTFFFLLHSIFCSYCHIFVGDGLNNVCHTLPPLRNHVTEKLRVRTMSLNVCFALLCFEISRTSKLSVSASQQATKGSKINVM